MMTSRGKLGKEDEGAAYLSRGRALGCEGRSRVWASSGGGPVYVRRVGPGDGPVLRAFDPALPWLGTRPTLSPPILTPALDGIRRSGPQQSGSTRSVPVRSQDDLAVVWDS